MKRPAFFVILSFVSLILLEIDANELTNNVNDFLPGNLFGFSGSKEFLQPDIDDSADGLPTMDLIEREGYPAEAHSVTTSDGYILTLHRIPGKCGSVPVLLQHGLLSSSADWVITGKGKGLAYLLADRGYDVWLGNARGNTYSRAHKTLSPTDSKFWDFSWTEMGLEDLPAVITYITNYKSDNLLYIGHSMGTTMFFVMAQNRPEIAKKVRAMMSFAPVAYMSHIKSPVRFIAPFSRDIELIARFLGADEFLPQNEFMRFLARYGCDIDGYEEKICANSVFAICGFDKDQFNYTLMPAILSHAPAGTSTKTIVHYAQEIVSGHFQAYDYGSEKNQKYYNSSTPPDYDPSKIQVPIAFFTADNDWLAANKDVNRLWGQLPVKIENYRIKYKKFNHVDFLYANDAPKLVYKKVYSVLEQYNDNSESNCQSNESGE